MKQTLGERVGDASDRTVQRQVVLRLSVEERVKGLAAEEGIGIAAWLRRAVEVAAGAELTPLPGRKAAKARRVPRPVREPEPEAAPREQAPAPRGVATQPGSLLDEWRKERKGRAGKGTS